MARQRVEHQFHGNDITLCDRCGKPSWLHRPKRERKREDKRDRSGRIQYRPPRTKEFFGIDGEGIDRANHRYVLLTVANLEGDKVFSIQDFAGLRTQKIFEFLYALPDNIKLFSYSDTYDLTKILTDVSDEVLWSLWRPETRQRTGKAARKGPRSVHWQGWELNMQGTKFTLKKRGNKKTIVIWDIWKFYQSKFTAAAEDWKIAPQSEIEEMDNMKNQRSELDRIFQENPKAVIDYNVKECRWMAKMATLLVEAHRAADLELKTFYGAGSTATCILERLEIDKYISKGPEEMQDAIAKAYFGGRFENAYIGHVEGPVYSYDLSSAYPYHITHLPCLVCGKWEKTTSRKKVAEATAALVHYRIRASVNTKHWAPFPFRDSDGSIVYPVESPGGWLWRDEFLAGEKHFDGVEFIEAWVYNTDCGHQPFKELPLYYIERCRIGKEGPGIVIKLGCNSVYGKLAQSVGRGKYQSWIWAGMVTSGCRAQILEAIALHKDRSNLLMIATDGILTRERLKDVLPRPMDTGTYGVYECEKHKKTCGICPESERKYKPLGGWEEKISERSVFLARPGIYFPMNPSKKDIRTIRARGVGRSVIVESWKDILAGWDSWDKQVCYHCRGKGEDCKECSGSGGWAKVQVQNVSRFCGAKTSISRRVVRDEGGKPRFVYHRANGNHMAKDEPKPCYGQWITHPVTMSFNPYPKRGGLSDGGFLTLRSFSGTTESQSYKKARLSKEAKQLKKEQELLQEQPTGDYTYY